jgi:hypothetical protein
VEEATEEAPAIEEALAESTTTQTTAEEEPPAGLAPEEATAEALS